MVVPNSGPVAAALSCILCDDGDYHNDPDNYDENGTFVGPRVWPVSHV